MLESVCSLEFLTEVGISLSGTQFPLERGPLLSFSPSRMTSESAKGGP